MAKEDVVGGAQPRQSGQGIFGRCSLVSCVFFMVALWLGSWGLQWQLPPGEWDQTCVPCIGKWI